MLTRGSCNIGKLNYYLGARAAREGRQSLYPDIDFCTDPEATCQSSVTEELRWTTAMFVSIILLTPRIKFVCVCGGVRICLFVPTMMISQLNKERINRLRSLVRSFLAISIPVLHFGGRGFISTEQPFKLAKE